MIKSVEAIIAIMILILFMLVLFNSYTYNDYKEKTLLDKTYDVINLKAQENDFRESVSENNVEAIYNSFYTHINLKYSVKLCDFLEESENCLTFGETIPENLPVYAVNYYFFDSHKTLNILIWT